MDPNKGKPKKSTLLLSLVASAALILSACNSGSQADPLTTSPKTEPISTQGQELKEDAKEAPPEENVASQPTATGAIDNDGGSFSSKDLIYFIVTDRFKALPAPGAPPLSDIDPKDPYAYHGGNLRGITASLDYIKSLGATAIWLTPVQKNGPKGYHGYWIHDFWTVDPHLGTLEDLKTLVSKAHEMDIKVMLDYVVNHTGYDSPWFNDPQKKHWFNPNRSITNWNDKKQLERGWLFGLPDINLDLAETQQFFVDNALWWIEETGIDGMRLDTVKHVPESFWTKWSAAIKAKYPDFYLLGEVWTEHVSILDRYRATGIDGVTNYPLYEGLSEALSLQGSPQALALAIEKDQGFEGSPLSGIFIDNHDNSRLISKDPKHGKDFLKLGLVWAYSYPAIPILYYGTEVGLEGGKDPDNRRDMPWKDTPSPELLKLTKALGQWRSDQSEGYTWLYHDAAVALYIRGKDLVLLNFSDQAADLEITLQAQAIPEILKNTKRLDPRNLGDFLGPNLSFKTSSSNETITIGGQVQPFGFGVYALVP